MVQNRWLDGFRHRKIRRKGAVSSLGYGIRSQAFTSEFWRKSRMELELTPDETSLLVGIIAIWKRIIPHERYEEMLAASILNKIFTEDRIAVDKILCREGNSESE